MESDNEYIIALSTIEKEDPKIASIFTWSDSINIQSLFLQPHTILFMPLLCMGFMSSEKLTSMF